MPHDMGTVQLLVDQLVAAELLFPRESPPHVTYVFKHALIQDAAYQSLLRRTRQQYHQRIAQVLAERFPETVRPSPKCSPITLRRQDSVRRHLATGSEPACEPHSVLPIWKPSIT